MHDNKLEEIKDQIKKIDIGIKEEGDQLEAMAD